VLAGLAVIPSLSLVVKKIRFAAGASWYERLADVIAGLADAQRQTKVLADFIQ